MPTRSPACTAVALLLFATAGWQSPIPSKLLAINGLLCPLRPGEQAVLPEAYGWKAFILAPGHEDGQATCFEAGYSPQTIGWNALQGCPAVLLRYCAGNAVGISNVSSNGAAQVYVGTFGLGRATSQLAATGGTRRLCRYETAAIYMPARRIRVQLKAADNSNRLVLFWAGSDEPACIALNTPSAEANPCWRGLRNVRLAKNSWDTTANWMGRTILIANLSPTDTSVEVSTVAD
jgi:hypothetical protein